MELELSVCYCVFYHCLLLTSAAYIVGFPTSVNTHTQNGIWMIYSLLLIFLIRVKIVDMQTEQKSMFPTF